MFASQINLSCRYFASLLSLSLLLCCTQMSVAQDVETLPLILRYDAGGIDNIVKAIQWSPDGKTLYAAGWAKAVQVYRLDEATQQFHYLPQQNFRIPIDAGRAGIVEAMLLSPDGTTLIVAGSAWDGVATAPTGYLWPRSSASEQDWQRVGTITVFNTVTRVCRVFRGHQGAIRQLAFVDNGKEPTQFASLGFEYTGQDISQSVRVWSLETGQQIGQPLPLAHTLIPPSTDISPRIQAWQSASNVTQVAVATWRIDGTTPVSDLILWNPLQPGGSVKLLGAPVSLALQQTGQGLSRRLFCGGLGPAVSFSVGDRQQQTLQRVNGLLGDAIPMAAARIPASAESNSERSAVVSVRPLPNGDKDYRLSVQEGNNFRAVGALWVNRSVAALPTATLVEPVVAASPDGRFLSVAGSTQSDIRIYRISDLLRNIQPAGELQPLQILNGRLLRPASAVFARTDKKIGIAISTENGRSLKTIPRGTPIPPDAVIVDSAMRTAKSEASGWTADGAETGQWNSRISFDRHQISVSHGSSPGRFLRLPADYRAEGFQEEVTASAVCSEHGKNPALTAVATHAQGEPFLHVYDSATGQCLRRLQGHERRITDLTFSADGRHLLSTSLDGTVRVWLLEDLASATINQVGGLRGLFVETADTGLRINRIEADSFAARAGIRQGDLIAGILAGGDLSPITTPSEFYLRISQSSPDQHKTINLRLQRAGQPLDVAVPLEQGIDLRTPLLSLLLSSLEDEQNPGARQWLAWSPLGQFDVIGSSLERQLGWHINTKDDAAPVRFSSVEQYRDQFFQQGLLLKLLGGEEVTVQKAVPPEIRVSLITASGDVSSPNYDDELVLREPAGELILELEDPTGDVVSTADWFDAGQATHSFSRIERDIWKSELTATDLGRDQHRVVVRYLTSDVPPAEFSRTIFLRYQPAPPKLKLESPKQSLSIVKAEKLQLEAAVEIAVKADITVIHEFLNAERAEFTSEIAESGILKRELDLKPGRNVIRIQARNGGIPESVSDYASSETATIETVVEYAPVGPPQIAIEEIRETDHTDAELPLVINGKLTVKSPVITIRGRMESDELLQEAMSQFAEIRTALTGFKAGENRAFEFSETVQLKPGAQRIEFSGSAGGATGTLPIDIVFQPPLPEISLIRPDNRDIILVAGESDERAAIEFRLDEARRYPFDYQVFVDGKSVDAAAVSLEAESGLLTASVSLTSDLSQTDDTHRIELRLSNEWGSRIAFPLTVRFKHPPKLVNAVVKRAEGTALADIKCDVTSSASRRISEMGLRVNGIEARAVQYSDTETDGTHKITLPAVALTEGANRIEVYAVNRDGNSNVIVINEIVPPAPKKADIRLIRPLISQTSSRPSQPIAFVVTSERGLDHVDLIVERDFREPQRISLINDAGRQQPDTDLAVTEYQFEHVLSLTTGVNRVRIEVSNRGGVTDQEFAITYLPPPVSISVQRLVTSNTISEINTGGNSSDNSSFESSVQQGATTLEGKIEWIPGHRPSGRNWTVRVWVNGFLKTLKVPAPAEGIEMAEFSIPLLLNQPQNRLRIEAPEIASSNQKLALEDHSIASLQNIFVSCAEPELRQRLHLVLMGVQMENGRNVCRAEDLTESAALALRLHTPETAFASIKSYTTLVGERAIGRNLRTMMVLIEAQMAQQRLASGINDVVMFYYRGREYRTTGGEFVLEDFQNYENPAEHPQSISESYLAGLFEHLPGAHVVFLDIENAQNEISAAAQWPRFPNLGLFRVAWSGQKPLPNPPGPLFTALLDATDVKTPETVVDLGRIEKLLHKQLQTPAPDRRFVLETFVPDDLQQLMIARIPSVSAREQ